MNKKLIKQLQDGEIAIDLKDITQEKINKIEVAIGNETGVYIEVDSNNDKEVLVCIKNDLWYCILALSTKSRAFARSFTSASSSRPSSKKITLPSSVRFFKLSYEIPNSDNLQVS